MELGAIVDEEQPDQINDDQVEITGPVHHTKDEISVFQFALDEARRWSRRPPHGLHPGVRCRESKPSRCSRPHLGVLHAHVVRAFKKAEATQPVLARVGRGFLGELYAIEHEDEEGLYGPARVVHRQKGRPVLERYRRWISEVAEGDLPPSDPLRKVTACYLRHWDNLTRFMDDGDLPIDNNQAEREFQRHAKTRYARLFAGSPEGGHRWATLLGVVRTAQKCALDVQAYLTWVFERRGTHCKMFNMAARELRAHPHGLSRHFGN